MIHVLDGPEGPINETKDMIKVATDFYKDPFRWEAKPDIHLSDDFFSHSEKINPTENESLEKRFIENDMREAVFGSYADRAPGPDGIPFVFYQKFWDIIKKDLI
jgi:hypothetical protein